MARLFDDATLDKLENDGTGPVSVPPITLAGWAYPDASGLVMVMCGVGSGATGNGTYRIGVLNTNLAFANRQQDISTTNAFAGGTTPIALNTWQHIAGTMVGSSPCVVTVFYNGVSDGTGSASLSATSTTRTSIGQSPGQLAAGIRAWSGSLAEIGMWNVELSAAEIAALAKGYAPALIRPTALRFYAPLVRDVQDVRGSLALTATGTSVSVHPRVFAAGGLI